MLLSSLAACAYFDSSAVAAGGLVASAVVHKVASDFRVPRNYRRTLTALSVVGTGIATYLVATSKQPSTHLAFISAGKILVGTGIATGAYVVCRDAIHQTLGWRRNEFQYKLGWMTAVKLGLCGVIVAAGVWSNPFFQWCGKDLAPEKGKQPHVPTLHHRTVHKNVQRAP